jgi:putative transposase
MVSLRQGLLAEGVRVSMAQLCRWFEQPSRTVYYKPVKSPPKVRPELAGPIKAMIEEEPSFGYRTVASLLGMNKNTVQRVFRKRPPIPHSHDYITAPSLHDFHAGRRSCRSRRRWRCGRSGSGRGEAAG